MIRIHANIPTRVDLAGGTLDLWPIHHLLDRKATVNIGVTLNADVEVSVGSDKRIAFISRDQDLQVEGNRDIAIKQQKLPLFGLLLDAIWPADAPGLTLTTFARSPAGAGLGGSSCLGIAMAAALYRARQLWETSVQRPVAPDFSEEELVRLVQDAEARLIKTPTGCQDYWGGLRGRVNIISFPFGKTNVETLPSEAVAGLDERLVLCYSGKSRASAINNWEIFKRLFDGDKGLLEVFQEIGSIALDCAQALQAGQLTEALRLSEKEWCLRLRLWPAIETPETKRLDLAAKNNGALFSRVCGAGGGGVMAIFCPPEHKMRVANALAKAGGQVLEAGVAPRGLIVESLKNKE